MKLRLGTRGSPLANRQSAQVAKALEELGHEVELIRITTRKGRSKDSEGGFGGLGELRAAVREGKCDFAVHAIKNMPLERAPGLVVAAVPVREDPRDALCARDDLRFAELPTGARVGTGAPRRVAQLRAIRHDLDYVDIRGDVAARLARVALGDFDAVVLAAAGLNRLGLQSHITDVLDILPAPGQGALALECRRDDTAVREALAALEDPDTLVAVTAERAVLRALGGGSAAPIGALGTPAQSAGGTSSTRTVGAGQPSSTLSAGPSARTLSEGPDDGLDTPHLTGGVFALDGSRSLVLSVSVSTPEAAGQWVAQELVSRGASDICDLTTEREERVEEFHEDVVEDTQEHIFREIQEDVHLGGSVWPRGRQIRGARVFLPMEEGTLSAAIEAAGPTVICEPLDSARAPSPNLWKSWNAEEFDVVVIGAGTDVHAIDDLLGWPPTLGVLAVAPSAATVLAELGVAAVSVPGDDIEAVVRALSDLLTDAQTGHESAEGWLPVQPPDPGFHHGGLPDR